jgi:hypothetical protein
MFVLKTPTTTNNWLREPIDPRKCLGDNSAKYSGNIPEKNPTNSP